MLFSYRADHWLPMYVYGVACTLRASSCYDHSRFPLLFPSFSITHIIYQCRSCTVFFPTGQRARNVRLYCRGKRVSAIAAMAIHGLVDVYCSNGSVDGDTFCEFLERSLLPKLMPFNGINPRSVVVMDNASIHHTRDAIELIQSVGSLVHFLPPYSPDLNPVEELFSKVKYSLKENDSVIQTVPESAIMDIVQAAFSTITDSDCFSWFEHAGYVS